MTTPSSTPVEHVRAIGLHLRTLLSTGEHIDLRDVADLLGVDLLEDTSSSGHTVLVHLPEHERLERARQEHQERRRGNWWARLTTPAEPSIEKLRRQANPFETLLVVSARRQGANRRVTLAHFLAHVAERRIQGQHGRAGYTFGTFGTIEICPPIAPAHPDGRFSTRELLTDELALAMLLGDLSGQRPTDPAEQEILARRLGVTPRALSHWIQRLKHEPWDVQHLVRISHQLPLERIGTSQ